MEINKNAEKDTNRNNRPFLWQIEQIDRNLSFEKTKEEKINNFLINKDQIDLIKNLIPEIEFKNLKNKQREDRPYLWEISQIDRENSFAEAKSEWENDIRLNYQQDEMLKKLLNEIKKN